MNILLPLLRTVAMAIIGILGIHINEIIITIIRIAATTTTTAKAATAATATTQLLPIIVMTTTTSKRIASIVDLNMRFNRMDHVWQNPCGKRNMNIKLSS